MAGSRAPRTSRQGGALPLNEIPTPPSVDFPYDDLDVPESSSGDAVHAFYDHDAARALKVIAEWLVLGNGGPRSIFSPSASAKRAVILARFLGIAGFDNVTIAELAASHFQAPPESLNLHSRAFNRRFRLVLPGQKVSTSRRDRRRAKAKKPAEAANPSMTKVDLPAAVSHHGDTAKSRLDSQPLATGDPDPPPARTPLV